MQSVKKREVIQQVVMRAYLDEYSWHCTISPASSLTILRRETHVCQ